MKSFYQFYKIMQEQGAMPQNPPTPAAQPTGNAVSPPEGVDPMVVELQKTMEKMGQYPQYKQLVGTFNQALSNFQKQSQAQQKQQQQQQQQANQQQQRPPQPNQQQPQQPQQPAPNQQQAAPQQQMR